MAVGVVNRHRTILASAARTTTQTVGPFNNNAYRGVALILDVTSAGTGSITPAIQVQDPVSGKWVTIHAAAAAVIANGTTVYVVYPGLSATEEGGITLACNASLWKTWRVVITANNANAMTYSVGAVELI